MNFMRKGKLLKFILIITSFLSLLIFTRFYNLEHTARFIWDESSDLVKIHQYFIDKTVTLVGPISEDGSKVFGSLTYYMLMPFAVIGNFSPISTAIGAGFWGALTSILILVLVNLLDKKRLVVVALLTLVWFPLLQTSRWAWNPNLIPFWTVLALIFYNQRKKYSFLLSGICLGLTIHLHYVSIFAIAGFLIVNFVLWIKKKINLFELIQLVLGVVLMIIPFIIFDLLHPPGLFLSRVMYFNQISTAMTFPLLVTKLVEEIKMLLYFYVPSNPLSVLLGFSLIPLVILDIKKRSSALIYFVPFIVQIFGLLAIGAVIYEHYTLPVLIFFLAWIIYPRKNKLSSNITQIILVILVVGGLLSIKTQLSKTSWDTNISATNEISNLVAETITSQNLLNVGVVTLQSPDPNPYGRRYRDLLLIKGVTVMDKDLYTLADHLFVVSYGSEEEVRTDKADVMKYFGKGNLIKSWDISESNWKLYLFNRN